MKSQLFAIAAALMLVAPWFTFANSPAPEPMDPAHCFCRPDALAPIGVMYDHTMAAGQFMFNYRVAFSHDEGLLNGGESIPLRAVYSQRNPAGAFFMSAAKDMDMYMHMPEIMWAPTDWLTLMIMPMYMEMTMTMVRSGSHPMGRGEMSHTSAGWSDTAFAGTVPLWTVGTQSLTGVLGISAPTGAVDEKLRGRLTHYMMQLGSGTWDLRPGLTYTGNSGDFSWGAQSLGTLRLEDENSSGYQLGNVVDLTGWVAAKLLDSLSVSARLAWRSEGHLQGQYNGPHGQMSPPDIEWNYGGERLDLGAGLNFVVPKGPLQGHRLAVEALFPVCQEVNGIQLERDFTLFAGWGFTF